jgi:hypothetical protein
VGDKIEKNNMDGAYSLDGGGEKVLVGKPEGKTPLERPRHRWKDNIKTHLQEVGCGVWNGLSWLRIETDGQHL